MTIHLRLQGGAVIVPVKVTPKGSRNEILPFRDGDVWVKVKVTAPPEDGQANAALLVVLAKQLQLPSSRLRLASGLQARQKQVAVAVSNAEEMAVLQARLAQVLHSDPALCFT